MKIELVLKNKKIKGREKQMKKCLNIVIMMLCMMLLLIPIVKADSEDMITLQLTVTENKEQKDFELYMLLPEQYITYAIQQANLDIEYEGAETLKQNEIQGIDVDKSNIQDETYHEAGVEYIQIRLEPNDEGVYTFQILSAYNRLDMKFRIKNDEKDYIMHIDNFKIEDNICEIEYNYDKDEIKQPTKIVINFGTLLLIIILVIIIIIAIISKIKTKE